MKLPIDIGPLVHSAAFRRVWIGSTATAFGSQLGAFAAALHVWQETNDALLLGAIGMAKAVPLIVFAVIGGTASDRLDRKTVALIAASGQTASAAALAVVLLISPGAIPALFVLVFVQSAFTAYGAPARRSFVAMLLPPEQVGAGVALTNVSFQVSMLLGPACAGLISALWSTPVCFIVEALGLAIAFYGISRIPRQPSRQSSPSKSALHDTFQGFAYLARKPILAVAMLSDLNATVFAMPVALFPVINSEKFGGDPLLLGLYAPALAAGGLIAGFAAGAYSARKRPGIIMLGAGIVWAGSILGFSLSPTILIALFFLLVAGAADTVAVVTRGTLIQLAVEEEYRGRVSGADYVVGVAGPEVGNARAGLVASFTTGAASAAIGASLSLVGAVLLTALGRKARAYTVEGSLANR